MMCFSLVFGEAWPMWSVAATLSFFLLTTLLVTMLRVHNLLEADLVVHFKVEIHLIIE